MIDPTKPGLEQAQDAKLPEVESSWGAKAEAANCARPERCADTKEPAEWVVGLALPVPPGGLPQDIAVLVSGLALPLLPAC
jgi:hypothetical protein